ncbi:MAG: hypothetical protein AB2563_11150 [Candidatus Thiodiazotropha endolucinida]
MSQDDEFDTEKPGSLKGNESISQKNKRDQEKDDERVASDIDLLGDSITWYDPELDKRRDIDLLGDGITYLDPTYDERFREDQFYNEPIADADYGHWGKVAAYSSAEAAALLLGKAPEVVTPESIKLFIQKFVFPKKYIQTYTLIDRAISMGELRSKSDLIKPADFLEWAKEMQLDIPNGLVDAIEGRSKDVEIESSGVQSTEQKKHEHDHELQKVANHLAQELYSRTGERAIQDDVVNTMIKIIEGKYSTDQEIEALLKANARVRKSNKMSSLKTTILRRIRTEW